MAFLKDEDVQIKDEVDEDDDTIPDPDCLFSNDHINKEEESSLSLMEDYEEEQDDKNISPSVERDNHFDDGVNEQSTQKRQKIQTNDDNNDTKKYKRKWKKRKRINLPPQLKIEIKLVSNGEEGEEFGEEFDFEGYYLKQGQINQKNEEELKILKEQGHIFAIENDEIPEYLVVCCPQKGEDSCPYFTRVMTNLRAHVEKSHNGN